MLAISLAYQSIATHDVESVDNEFHSASVSKSKQGVVGSKMPSKLGRLSS